MINFLVKEINFSDWQGEIGTKTLTHLISLWLWSMRSHADQWKVMYCNLHCISWQLIPQSSVLSRIRPWAIKYWLALYGKCSWQTFVYICEGVSEKHSRATFHCQGKGKWTFHYVYKPLSCIGNHPCLKAALLRCHITILAYVSVYKKL